MDNNKSEHIPVLILPTLEYLNIQTNGIYIDGTFGRGGHSQKILEKLGEDGRLIVIDQDHQAIDFAQQCFANDNRVIICRGNFSQLESIVEQQGLVGKIDGILLDLGVSSPQLDQAERGFSFMKDGPLDMRMDQRSDLTAAKWIAETDEQTMSKVFWRYGEEKYSRKIAKHIVATREKKALTRTSQLAELVDSIMPNKHKMKKHAATRVFQAIRICINKEFEQLEQVLAQGKTVLKVGGRFCVISFHSLEDRIVKQTFQSYCSVAETPRFLPVMGEDVTEMKHIKKKVKANKDELLLNPRSRSALLRVVEKC